MTTADRLLAWPCILMTTVTFETCVSHFAGGIPWLELTLDGLMAGPLTVYVLMMTTDVPAGCLDVLGIRGLGFPVRIPVFGSK